MSVVFDTSALPAVALAEPGGEAVLDLLSQPGGEVSAVSWPEVGVIAVRGD